jgi:hypothetical protein
MLLRTHGTAITIVSTTLMVYSTKRLGRKFAMFTGVSTCAVCFAGIRMVNYKFY